MSAEPGRARVLIVDDEPNIVASLRFLMERSGFAVAIATDGDAALTAFEDVRPDLVILDVMLPRRSGHEVCQQLRARPGGQAVKIIMLTARGRDVAVAKGLDAGADEYVTKPFATRELVALVEAMLEVDGATGA